MKVIITGTKSITHYMTVFEVIKTYDYWITEIITCGSAQGVDACAEKFAKDHCLPLIPVPIDWKDLTNCPSPKSGPYGLYNPAAGKIRNKEMAEYADTLIAIWDGQFYEVQNLIDCMKKLHKPVLQVVIH